MSNELSRLKQAFMTGIENQSKVIPKGNYPLKVSQAKFVADGGKERLEVSFEVYEGEHKGVSVNAFLYLAGYSEKAHQIGTANFAALVNACGFREGEFEAASDFEGKVVTAYLSEYEDNYGVRQMRPSLFKPYGNNS